MQKIRKYPFKPFQNRSKRSSCLTRTTLARVWVICSTPTIRDPNWTSFLSPPLSNWTNRFWDFSDTSRRASLSPEWKTLESENWSSTTSSRTDQFWWSSQRWSTVEPCKAHSSTGKWYWSRMVLTCPSNQLISELDWTLEFVEEQFVYMIPMTIRDHSSIISVNHNRRHNLAQKTLSLNRVSQFLQRRIQNSWNS